MSGQAAGDRLERGLSLVLVVGVAASAALVAIGFGGSFSAGWTGSLIGSAAATTATTDFSDLLGRLLVLQPLAITQFGLLVLIGTPVFRVGLSIIGFAAERDWRYVAVSGLVFALLLASLALLR
jgi:uncharacterized membrane protein